MSESTAPKLNLKALSQTRPKDTTEKSPEIESSVVKVAVDTTSLSQKAQETPTHTTTIQKKNSDTSSKPSTNTKISFNDIKAKKSVVSSKISGSTWSIPKNTQITAPKQQGDNTSSHNETKNWEKEIQGIQKSVAEVKKTETQKPHETEEKSNKISFSDIKKSPEVPKATKAVAENTEAESSLSQEDTKKDLTEGENQDPKNTSDEKSKVWTEKQENGKATGIHFSNYESSFQKQSWHVLKKLQNFKYAPKTRVGFILWLVSITVFTLGALMLMFPEKHSIEIYKASILEIYQGNNSWKPVSNKNTSASNADKTIDPIPSSNSPNIPDDSEILPSDKEDNISPTESVKQETQVQKERLHQHLINKYSS